MSDTIIDAALRYQNDDLPAVGANRPAAAFAKALVALDELTGEAMDNPTSVLEWHEAVSSILLGPSGLDA
jgi:hypothetical protein